MAVDITAIPDSSTRAEVRCRLGRCFGHNSQNLFIVVKRQSGRKTPDLLIKGDSPG